MKNLFRIAALIAVVAMFGFTFTSCDLNKEKEVPQPELISQGFTLEGISIARKKSFDINAWLFEYNTEYYTFTLTGQGAAAGNVYTQDVSINQLASGSFTVDILPGEYRCTFESEHLPSLDPDVWQFVPPSTDVPIVGENLDIAIDNTLLLLGTPIPLVATHSDFMVVVDIPNLMTGLNNEGVMVHFDMLNTDMDGGVHLSYNMTGDFHHGYLSSGTASESQGFSPVLLKFFHEGDQKSIDLTSCVGGRVYHFISDFGATTTLEIPDMITEVIVVP